MCTGESHVTVINSNMQGGGTTADMISDKQRFRCDFESFLY